MAPRTFPFSATQQKATSPHAGAQPRCPERNRRDPAPRRRVRRFFSTRRLTHRPPYAGLRTPVPRVRFSRFLRSVLNLSLGTVIFLQPLLLPFSSHLRAQAGREGSERNAGALQSGNDGRRG